MTDLDQRLRELIEDRLRFIITAGLAGTATTEEAIAQIKQAFEEAGYVQSYGAQQHANAVFMLNEGYMTGQEWLERFKHELNGTDATDPKSYLYAARRASGLEKEDK